jgi:hypothetical protein
VFSGITDLRAELPISVLCPKARKFSVLPTPRRYYWYGVSGGIFLQVLFNRGGGRSNRPSKFSLPTSFSFLSEISGIQGSYVEKGVEPYACNSIRWVSGGGGLTGYHGLFCFYPTRDSTPPQTYPLTPISLQRPGTCHFRPELQLLLPPQALTPSNGDFKFPPLKIKSNPWKALP